MIYVLDFIHPLYTVEKVMPTWEKESAAAPEKTKQVNKYI